MRNVKFLEIPARGRLELKPSGKHLMLLSLKRPLREGETIPLTLYFADGTGLELAVKVQNR